MSEPSTPQLPAWVYKRDGRLVPFDPDRICQALFAASEALGQPSAFLARELTDGVLHFLALEHAGVIPTTTQVAEQVAKVVRELGHPALAAAFAEWGDKQHFLEEGSVISPKKPGPAGTFAFSARQSPELVVEQCLREYSLQAVFSRDLVAAQTDGLLWLGDLDAPVQLNSCLFPQQGNPQQRWWPELSAMRKLAGGVILDSPELALESPLAARTWAREFAEVLEALGLWAVVNLNCTRTPQWADERVAGPLFAGTTRELPSLEGEDIRATLVDTLLSARGASGRIWVDWHVGETSVDQVPSFLLRALEATQIRFALDRSRTPIVLAEGINRHHPAVLQVVGVHFPRLMEVLQVGREPKQLLQKMPSLAGMLVSAGVQKRQFLRDRGRPEILRSFLLDRARLVVVPVGLEATVRTLVGQGISEGPQGLDWACQILASLAANLRGAGRRANLDVVLDSPPCGLNWQEAFAAPTETKPTSVADGPLLAGVTPGDLTASPRSQIRAAGSLHAAAEGGTAKIFLAAERFFGFQEFIEELRWAWKRTDLVRLAWHHLSPTFRQNELLLSEK